MTLIVRKIKEKYLRKFDFLLSVSACSIRKVRDELTHSVRPWTSALMICVVSANV